MYFHHTMTDGELIRAADACENPQLRMLADRLESRSNALAQLLRLYGRIPPHEFEDLTRADEMPRLDEFLIAVDRVHELIDQSTL